jgi:hypothetical protein
LQHCQLSGEVASDCGRQSPASFAWIPDPHFSNLLLVQATTAVAVFATVFASAVVAQHITTRLTAALEHELAEFHSEQHNHPSWGISNR